MLYATRELDRAPICPVCKQAPAHAPKQKCRCGLEWRVGFTRKKQPKQTNDKEPTR